MSQSKLGSLLEAWVGTVVGFVLSLILQELISRWYHFNLSFTQNLQIVCIFTVVSVLRGYIIRRLFNKYIVRKAHHGSR